MLLSSPSRHPTDRTEPETDTDSRVDRINEDEPVLEQQMADEKNLNKPKTKRTLITREVETVEFEKVEETIIGSAVKKPATDDEPLPSVQTPSDLERDTAGETFITASVHRTLKGFSDNIIMIRERCLICSPMHVCHCWHTLVFPSSLEHTPLLCFACLLMINLHRSLHG